MVQIPQGIRVQCSQLRQTLRFPAGKRSKQAVKAHYLPAPSAAAKGVIYLTDRISGRRFLVDTGSAVSLFPCTRPIGPVTRTLTTADGGILKCYGTKKLQLDLPGIGKVSWTFTLAPSAFYILGADFLRHHAVCVDLAQQKVFRKKNPTPSAASPPPLHVEHFIETTGPPCHTKARFLPPDKEKFAKKHFKELENSGVLRKSSSPWSSALHMVPKKDGSFRPCGDFRALNNKTTPDRYPLPTIKACTHILPSCKIFSTIDIERAFHHIPVRSEDIEKTATITPFGLYEWTKMPFGLRNAAQTFQRFMDGLLQDCPFAFAYLDDVLVASKSPQEHEEHLRRILDILKENKISIKHEKCQWRKQSVKFLGHTISQEGCSPLREKVAAIESFPKPHNQKELRSFLGMVNFYNRFLPNAATVMSPLYALITSPKRGKSVKVAWNDNADAAFRNTKELLAEATLLAHPGADAPLRLTTDASDFAAGAVLQQMQEGIWKPLAFFSKKFSAPQTKYSAFSRELLAVTMAIKHFRDFLEGHCFHVVTDHKPLIGAVKGSRSSYSPRDVRQLEFINEFTSDIRHLNGADNIVADALSRAPAAVVSHFSIDFKALAESQDDDAVALETQNSNLKMSRIPFHGHSVWCDTSSGNPRPYIPEALRFNAFQTFHSLSHPGHKITAKNMLKSMVWRGLKRDVRTWCLQCDACQRAKPGPHRPKYCGDFKPVSQRFEVVHVDLVGKLPSSQGKNYLLTIMDRFSRFPAAIPLHDITATGVVNAFVSGWISTFGPPKTIVSDNGTQFTSSRWKDMLRKYDIKHNYTSTYSPQGNGLLERWHRRLKEALRAKACNNSNWVADLPETLLALRNDYSEELGCSPAEILFGENTSFRQTMSSIGPSPLSQARLTAEIHPPQPNQQARDNPKREYLPHPLRHCQQVMIEKGQLNIGSLSERFCGPYDVVKRNATTFTLKIGGKETPVSARRVKPYFPLLRN